ncbi:hypothetical protein LTR17_018073 [Elasticomyces elasticus]|nr:hypothetical protein LTR17_018073 [Elasticomyces elasticus]
MTSEANWKMQTPPLLKSRVEKIPKKKFWIRALKKYPKKDVKETPRESPSNSDLSIRHLSQWHVAKCREFFYSQPLPLEQKKIAFREARAHLARLSLITIAHDTKKSATDSISVHLPIVAWGKQRNEQRYEAWLSAACMLALSTKGSTEWQPYSSELEPHLVANLSSFESIEPDPQGDHSHRRQLCRVWYLYGYQLVQLSNPFQIDCCELLLEQTHTLSVNLADDRQVVEGEYLLAMVYRYLGRVKDAVKLLEHVVSVEKGLAENDADRLLSQHELAKAYLENEQVAQAIELLEHVVRARRDLAEDKPRAAIISARTRPCLSRARTGRTRAAAARACSAHKGNRAYWHSKRYQEALDLIQHVVRVQEITLRADHRNRVSSEKVLAGILEDMARLQTSESAGTSIPNENATERERKDEMSGEDAGPGAEVGV